MSLKRGRIDVTQAITAALNTSMGPFRLLALALDHALNLVLHSSSRQRSPRQGNQPSGNHTRFFSLIRRNPSWRSAR